MSAFIYKIVCDKTDKIYIGSTVSPLNTRLSQHKLKYKKYNNYTRGKRCSWSTCFELFELGNCKIELIETCEKINRFEREKYHIKQNKDKTINYLYNNETQCLSVNATSEGEQNKEERREFKEMDK